MSVKKLQGWNSMSRAKLSGHHQNVVYQNRKTNPPDWNQKLSFQYQTHQGPALDVWVPCQGGISLSSSKAYAVISGWAKAALSASGHSFLAMLFLMQLWEPFGYSQTNNPNKFFICSGLKQTEIRIMFPTPGPGTHCYSTCYSWPSGILKQMLICIKNTRVSWKIRGFWIWRSGVELKVLHFYQIFHQCCRSSLEPCCSSMVQQTVFGMHILCSLSRLPESASAFQQDPLPLLWTWKFQKHFSRTYGIYTLKPLVAQCSYFWYPKVLKYVILL